MRKKVYALLTLLLLSLGLFGRVLALELPEPDRSCSITIVMDFDGAPLDGGRLTLYRVAGISPDGSYFTLVEPLRPDGPALEDLQAPGLAKELNQLAVSRDLQPITAPIEDGQAFFSGLETGLYVVCQPAGDETPDFAAIDPFLISVPQWRSGTYVYDLTASPKVSLVPTPTEPTQPTDPTVPTTPETPPGLPQTGQLNWPVPLMTVMGLSFFCMGWILVFGHKREDT